MLVDIEALLKKCKEIYNSRTPFAASLIIREMEKAEAKAKEGKPIGDLHSVPHYRCPNCKGAVVMYKKDTKPSHCKWCGLKLNWGK